MAQARADQEMEELDGRFDVEGLGDCSDGSETSDSDERTTPPRVRKPSLRRGKRPLSDTEPDSDREGECATKGARRVRLLAPEVELKAITPASMRAVEAMKIFFKPKEIQEAASFIIPGDVDNEDEQEAYRQRAGRALARLKESCGSDWLRGSRPKDERALRSVREELIDVIVPSQEEI